MRAAQRPPPCPRPPRQTRPCAMRSPWRKHTHAQLERECTRQVIARTGLQSTICDRMLQASSHCSCHACCQRAGTWSNHACSREAAGSHKARASTWPGLMSRCRRPERCAAVSASPWRPAPRCEAWPCGRCRALPARAAAPVTPCVAAAVQEARRGGTHCRRRRGRRASRLLPDMGERVAVAVRVAATCRGCRGAEHAPSDAGRRR
jgi:hypothetical protein